MAVYYKFKSAKDYHSIPIEGQFISVVNLKERIFETKLSGKGTDFDLMISNAQSNEEYVDEGCMIPKNTSVLIRRVPGRTRKPIAIESDKPRLIDLKVEDLPPSSMLISNSPSTKHPEEYEWDVFGDDLYTIRDADPALTSNPVSDVSPANKVDEDNRIKALVDNPALDWNRQTEETFGAGRGFGRGGRMMGGRGFGRGMFERKTPPAGYVCHRCRVPGHFIQHCPTNGDPNYDIKKVKPPTGIPKSMLMVTSDGSYALPSGAIAVLKPNEAAFDKEMEGLTTTRLVSNFPPELHCPLCKEVMKDAALTSKCCLRSFCDKCIRDYIIMNTMCVCGATNILADDLLPNKTVRETINRISESTISCTEYSGSTAQIQDMESAHPMQPKVPSPTLSATSKDEPKKPTVEQSFLMKEVVIASETKVAKSERNSLENNTIMNVDVTESTLEYVSKEPKSPQSALVVAGDVQEKQLAGKKKKKKKPRLPTTAADMQWRTCQDIGADNFGMPLAAPGYNSYVAGGMPFGVDSYMTPFGGPMPFMGYTPGPFNVPFGGGILPQDPFSAHGYMMPALPRDLSGLGMGSVGMNQGPPTMSREEFEARKSDLRRKHDMERLCQRERGHPKDWEARRESSNMNDDASMKPKPQWPTSSDRDRFTKTASVDRNGPPRDSARNTPPRQATRKAADRHEHPVAAAAAAKAEYSHKPSVFSRIILSESGDAAGKKRKSSELKEPMTRKAAAGPDGDYGELKGGKSSSAGEGRRSRGYDYDSSDDERHFKRRPSASSRREAEAVREEAAARMSKRSREREFDGRGGSREAERSHDHLARRFAQR